MCVCKTNVSLGHFMPGNAPSPCSLTQSPVLSAAKAQPSANLNFVLFLFVTQADVSDTILETNCQLPNNQALHLFVRLALK